MLSRFQHKIAVLHSNNMHADRAFALFTCITRRSDRRQGQVDWDKTRQGISKDRFGGVVTVSGGTGETDI